MSGIDPNKALHTQIERWQSERRSAVSGTPTLSGATHEALATAAKEIGQPKNPTHMPMPKTDEATQGFHERLLDALGQRQQLIAANIANADTPQYKATDIDMSDAIQSIADNTVPPLTMRGSNGRHLLAAPLKGMQQLSSKYYTPHQPNADGNTVDMDAERSKLAENSVRYDFTLSRANDEYKDMLDLFKTIK